MPKPPGGRSGSERQHESVRQGSFLSFTAGRAGHGSCRPENRTRSSSRLPARRRSRFVRLLAAVFSLFVSMACQPAEEKTANILFINSYHRGYKWSDDIEAGLRDTLIESGRKIELSFEYLDSRRFTYGAQIPSLASSMAVKYARYRPVVVVVSDNAAFDFAVSNRERLFPGVPIVFGGYNNVRPAAVEGISDITGVNEEIDFARTVEMALAVHPNTSTLAFIVSTEDISSRNNASVIDMTVLPRFRDRHAIKVIKDASLEEVRELLQKLPRDSLLFLSGQIRNQAAGRTLTPDENGRLITAISPFPAYTFWDFHIGTGVIGGRVLRGHDQGRAMAELVLRILDGERAATIPVTMTSPARHVFDYAVMHRFGIGTADLPSDAVLVNRPDSVWEKYFPQIVGGIAFVVLQSGLMLILIYNMRLRRKAMESLEKERTSLEERVRIRTEELVGAKALATFAKEQDRAIEAERRRLAREVHDQIGQVFTAIKLIVDSLPRHVFPPGQEGALAQAMDIGIATTRRVTAELRPPLLDDLGLAAAVKHFVNNHPGLAGVDCQVTLDSASTLDAAQSLTLFRIVQEAVTNVVRHAKAMHLTITGKADPRYTLTIADDGCGLDLATVRPGALGLTGMRERINMLGGELIIRSRPGEGVTVECRLPLSNPSS